MSLTAAQNEAVTARGNVVVVAGAGTGKTSTLVERCLSCLVNENPPASLDEILIVTFTEAAAAEIRQRIRARLAGATRAFRDSAHRHLARLLPATRAPTFLRARAGPTTFGPVGRRSPVAG